MPESLWWLPSLLVFGAAAVVLGGAVVGLRRLGSRREHRDLEQGRAAEAQAKARIVQADDAVRDAEREVAFVEAQFGAASARELRATVDSARGRLREAFLLQQRLDDAEPDSAAERRSWTARIDDLCRSALAAIDAADAALTTRRRAERGAGDELPALREQAARLERRHAEASQMLDRLGTRFDASALTAVRSAARRAEAALTAAAEALDEAERRVDGSRPVEDRLAVAGDRVAQATRDLGEVEGFELELADAQASASEEREALEGELAAARRERDDADDADAGARLGEAVGEVSAVIAARSEVSGIRSPTAIACAPPVTGSRSPARPRAPPRTGSTAPAARWAGRSRSPRASCGSRVRRSIADAAVSGPMPAPGSPRPSGNSSSRVRSPTPWRPLMLPGARPRARATPRRSRCSM
ncbi:hypothetical protein [Agromyces neolithicus]|uniref:TPM domain-containing protein n=1 Tax=Agromyces neolithicus TaxID=269420 RepID=A0ABN2M6E2_9MICO